MNIIDGTALSALLRDKLNADSAPKILPEAAVARLREAASRYAEMLHGPRFKVGDWVTPTQDATIKGAGEPHVVVETAQGSPCFGKDCGTHDGRRVDIRVLKLAGADIAPFWGESFEYEPWPAKASA